MERSKLLGERTTVLGDMLKDNMGLDKTRIMGALAPRRTMDNARNRRSDR